MEIDPTDPTLRQRVSRIFDSRDTSALRELLEGRPELRPLINEPVCAFDTPPLVWAAGADDLGFVEVLLEFGADPNAKSHWWAGGFHALHSARGVVADRLIAAGAVPDACAAAQLDRLELLREIIDADPTRVHERGGDGQTPLHFARSREVVDLLLERGADVDARDVDHRATPAEWMLERRRGAGRYELARYLVDRGATADVFLAAALGLGERLRKVLEEDRRLLDAKTGEGAYGEQPPSSFHIYTWTIGQDLSPKAVAEQFEQPGSLVVLKEFEQSGD